MKAISNRLIRVSIEHDYQSQRYSEPGSSPGSESGSAIAVLLKQSLQQVFTKKPLNHSLFITFH
jgi:hypothetical protein